MSAAACMWQCPCSLVLSCPQLVLVKAGVGGGRKKEQCRYGFKTEFFFLFIYLNICM